MTLYRRILYLCIVRLIILLIRRVRDASRCSCHVPVSSCYWLHCGGLPLVASRRQSHRPPTHPAPDSPFPRHVPPNLPKYFYDPAESTQDHTIADTYIIHVNRCCGNLVHRFPCAVPFGHALLSLPLTLDEGRGRKLFLNDNDY